MKRANVVVFCLLFLGIAMAPVARAGDSDGYNTGVTFDGSDGNRSGMDIDVHPSVGNVPEVPPPTPVDTGSSYQPEPAPEPAPAPAPVETRSGSEVAE